MNEIKVGAVYHATEKELSDFPREFVLRNVKIHLSRLLVDQIINKVDVFETEETNRGIQFRAECYVLTPKDFSKLVERIQRDLARFGPTVTMIGGVSL